MATLKQKEKKVPWGKKREALKRGKRPKTRWVFRMGPSRWRQARKKYSARKCEEVLGYALEIQLYGKS